MGKALIQIQEKEVDKLKISLKKMTELFEEFEAAQETYASTLEELNEIEAAEQYYDDVITKYGQTRIEIIRFLEDPDAKKEATSSQQQQDMTSSLVQALNLPRVEIVKFDGNPRRYMTFMAIFKETVESVTKDGHTRLTQLLYQYHTTGEAHSTVESCVIQGGELGYKQAMEKLRSRFGSPHVVCETVLSDLRALPCASSALDLRHFADTLLHSSVVLKANDRHSEVDTQTFILSMCLKLKMQLRYKWRENAVHNLEHGGSYPTFDDFILFVEREALLENDPVYGGEALNTSSQKHIKSMSTSNGESSSFMTKVRSQCCLCNRNHPLYMCSQFIEQSLDERVKYVTDNKLCTICFLSTHGSDECRSPYRCTINKCNKRHSSLIHADSSSSNMYNYSVSMHANESNSMLLPIVPVTINGEFETYALLDTGSTNSFCSRHLATKLNLSGPRTKFNLNTLNTTMQHESEFVSYRLSSRNSSAHVNMENVRVVNCIPTHSGMCDVTKYVHLDDLHCPGNVTVDVLIGQDNPAVLIPRETRVGSEHEPFAVRGLLGWALNGPVELSNTLTSNLISTVTVEKLLEEEYVDAVADSHVQETSDNIHTTTSRSCESLSHSRIIRKKRVCTRGTLDIADVHLFVHLLIILTKTIWNCFTLWVSPWIYSQDENTPNQRDNISIKHRMISYNAYHILSVLYFLIFTDYHPFSRLLLCMMLYLIHSPCHYITV